MRIGSHPLLFAMPSSAAARSPTTDGLLGGDMRATTSQVEASALPSGAATRAPGRDSPAEAGESPVQQRLQQLEVLELSQRDREVRSHELAHAAVGGQYAGSPSYSFTRGPDGRRYAVAGEVSIDISPIPNDPEATLRKMEVVLRAALAPVEPSAQDLRVAAQARLQATQARMELAERRREEAGPAAPAGRTAESDDSARQSEQVQSHSPAPGAVEVYRQMNGLVPAEPRVDLLA